MDLPDPGIELGSPALQVNSLPTELSGKPLSYDRKHCRYYIYITNTSIKSKKIMYKEIYICIYKGNNSCIDTEETAI